MLLIFVHSFNVENSLKMAQKWPKKSYKWLQKYDKKWTIWTTVYVSHSGLFCSLLSNYSMWKIHKKALKWQKEGSKMALFKKKSWDKKKWTRWTTVLVSSKTVISNIHFPIQVEKTFLLIMLLNIKQKPTNSMRNKLSKPAFKKWDEQKKTSFQIMTPWQQKTYPFNANYVYLENLSLCIIKEINLESNGKKGSWIDRAPPPRSSHTKEGEEPMCRK